MAADIPRGNHRDDDNRVDELGVVLGETKAPQDDQAPGPIGPIRTSDGKAVDVSGADDSDIAEGTIVTDKKRTGPTVLGTIGSAVGEWTDEKTRAVKSMEVFQKPEAPKVVPGIKRKEVIKKAIQDARRVAPDDHKMVVDRIKTLQLDAEQVTGKPFVIKPAPVGAKPQWTHLMTDDQVPTSHVRRESITTEGQADGAPSIEVRTNASIEDYKKHEKNALLQRSSVVAQKDAQGAAPETDVRTVADPKPTPPPPAQKNVRQPATPPAPAPTPPKTTPPLPSVPPAQPSSALSFFSRSRIITGTVIIILLGGISSIFYYIGQRPSETLSPADRMARLDVAASQNVTFQDDRRALLGELHAAIRDLSGAVTEIKLVRQSETDVRPVTTGEFFMALAANVPSTFTRALHASFTIGGVRTDRQVPYFVFTTNNFDNAFAGMLAWEPALQADLAPLFGSPNGAMPQETGAMTFTDRTIDGYHVRVLTDEDGTVQILYAFIQETILIITTNEEAFRNLLDRL